MTSDDEAADDETKTSSGYQFVIGRATGGVMDARWVVMVTLPDGSTVAADGDTPGHAVARLGEKMVVEADECVSIAVGSRVHAGHCRACDDRTEGVAKHVRECHPEYVLEHRVGACCRCHTRGPICDADGRPVPYVDGSVAPSDADASGAN